MPDRATNITWAHGQITRQDRQRLLGQRGAIIWMTGLSGSGKSTIAAVLEATLLERGRLAYRLDGDNVRHGLNKNLGFSADDRAENIRPVGEGAKIFADAGALTIVSLISPYNADRQAVRASSPAGDFIEVYINVTLETAKKRDPKGLYKKALAGEIRSFTGIDDPYEPPERPEIIIDTEATTPEQAAGQILAYLENHGYLQNLD